MSQEVELLVQRGKGKVTLKAWPWNAGNPEEGLGSDHDPLGVN
jgi:hypothetical protein